MVKAALHGASLKDPGVSRFLWKMHREWLQFLGLDARDTETGVGTTWLCCQKGGGASCSDPSVEAARAESGAHLG